MTVKRLLGKKMAAAVLVAMMAFGLAACFPDTSSQPPSDPFTNGLFQALNADRQANGLPPLTWSPKLANSAGGWAVSMMQANSLVHNNLSAMLYSPMYSGYRTLGENIIVGPGSMSPSAIESAWRASPNHWRNITSTSFNVVGIGYARGPDGRIWAVQDFGGI
jgi:uncharacterized protein YkwD